MQKLEAFMVWLSANEATEEQKNEVVDSLDFEVFTVEELMTSVRDSRLYTSKMIEERVIDLSKIQDKLLREKGTRRLLDILNDKEKLLLEKDSKLKEQGLKILHLQDILRFAEKYVPSNVLPRLRSLLN